ncbi:MAG TPA: TspO/MBR family protein [Tianweitania sediminis]|jgi:tryptophan-rich sensory protein|nr:TspO/MBR family protein [Tianweitania sediminis]
MNRFLSLALFLLLTLGGGLLIGATNRPGEWYASLAKPVFNPPDWLFAPVWSALYILIAIVGWRTWRRGPTSKRMQVWWAQLILNFLWMPMFFGLQQMVLALLVILLLLAAIIAFMGLSWGKDRLATWLFAPYLLWTAYAALLNASLIGLN